MKNGFSTDVLLGANCDLYPTAPSTTSNWHVKTEDRASQTSNCGNNMEAAGDELLLVNQFNSYELLWHRTKVRVKAIAPWTARWRRIKWMNSRALPGNAYKPTEVEHIANVITHGLCIMPACCAGLMLIDRSHTPTQQAAALIYGAALILLFAVSTFFHSVHYCDRNGQLKDVLHRCDRAMIYIFIAGSYYPWLSLSLPAHPHVVSITNWLVWCLAVAGIVYQQLFHERYKCLETFFYVVMGVGPSLVILLCGHEFKGMDELKLGGLLYIAGIGFFKADGKIPCAHAIWHLFVGCAATIHYMAILNHLYSNAN